MSKIFSDKTAMSGTPDNLIIDTENMIYPKCNFISDYTIRAGISENPIVDTKSCTCSYSVESYIHVMFDLGQVPAILDVVPTMQCPKYFMATSLGRPYLKTL